MRIGPYEIGDGHPTFIVAELSCSHGGTYADAERLVEYAAQAGCHAVKTQFYTPNDLTCDSDHPAYVLTGGPWKGRRLWDLYQEGQTPHDWHAPLFKQARALGMAAFGTAYDVQGVTALRQSGTDALKIASFEVGDRTLIEAAEGVPFPVLVSTGFATPNDLRYLKGWVCLALLHCVSAYPARLWSLSRIRKLRKYADVVGFSDHTGDVSAGAAAVAAGAHILEVHLRLSDVSTPDSGFALTPSELTEYIRRVRQMGLMMADVDDPGVAPQRALLRRLVWNGSGKKGDRVTEVCVRTARCAEGLDPSMEPLVVGRTLRRPVKQGDPVVLEDMSA